MNIIEEDIKSVKLKNFPFIVLGMGCFWGAERKFWSVKGVSATAVGYSGGITNNPTYKEVCTGKTGHAEVVKIVYDNKLTNLKNLLKVFWESHDPTQLNRQGNDIGTQYRSLIYTNLTEEIKLPKQSMMKFQKTLNSYELGTIKTEISVLKNFYMAEEYHQKYLYKNPNGYCGLRGLNVNFTN